MRNTYTITNTYSYFNPAAYSYTKRQSNTKGSPDSSSSPVSKSLRRMERVAAVSDPPGTGYNGVDDCCSRLAVSRRSRIVAAGRTATQRRGYNNRGSLWSRLAGVEAP